MGAVGGLVDVAAEKGPGFYGIGVDADQDHIHPGRILTSMMKRVDNAVYQITQDRVNGKPASAGAGSST